MANPMLAGFFFYPPSPQKSTVLLLRARCVWNPVFSAGDERFPPARSSRLFIRTGGVKTGKRCRRLLLCEHFSCFKSLSAAAKLTWRRAGEFKSQLDARLHQDQRRRTESCQARALNKPKLNSSLPAAMALSFPQPRVCARARALPPTLPPCSFICVRVLTQLERLVLRASAGCRGERRGQEEEV